MISQIDTLTMFLSFSGLVSVFLIPKKKSGVDDRFILLGLWIFQVLYSLLLAGEWGGYISGMEKFEDILGAIIPLLWLFHIYTLIQSNMLKDFAESEQNLNTTIQSIGDAVISTDAKGRILHINPIAEHLSGWRAREGIGHRLDEVLILLDNDTRERCSSPVDLVLKYDDRIILTNMLLVSRQGTEYRISDSASPIRNADGEITGIVMVFRDISEEEKIQSQLLHSRKMDALGQLAGGVAHDFNNMLTGILGCTEVLLGSEEDKEKVEYLQTIMDAATRSSELTRKLLSFSRKRSRVLRTMNLHQTIEQAVSLLERTIDRNVEIEMKLECPHPIMVGDSSEIQNLFLNLGINGSDAMPQGGTLSFQSENLEVNQSLSLMYPFHIHPGTYLKITVSDTGTGIPEEDLSRIFDPFYSTKDEGKGTGLGLASVYACVNHHSGSIKVYSEQGVGTSFSVLFPISREDFDEQISDKKIIRGKGNIMVIDDEETVLWATSEMIRDLGYQVESINSGQEGLKILKERENSFDLVLLDRSMPDISGIECFHEIQMINPDIPIVLYSGFAKQEEVEGLLKEGLKGFIQKPFSQAHLSREIARILGEKV